MKQFSTYLLVFCILVLGCSPEEPVPVDLGLGYFPLRIGVFQVYQVEEKRYSGSGEPVIETYQIKVEVNDSFPNCDETFTYVLARLRRATAADSWENFETWSARINHQELVVNEGNSSFVKLAFPLKNGLTWDGNKFNSFGQDEYEITQFGAPATVGGTTFEETLTVTQEMNEDVIVFLDERREVYARNVGLIMREFRQLNYCTEDHCRGQQQIESGTEFKYELVEYGNL